MTDLLPLWIEEAVTHNRRMAIKAQIGYDKLKNKETVYAKSLLAAANAYRECVTIWQNVTIEPTP